MSYERERLARELIQKRRPSAVKNGLYPAITKQWMLEHGFATIPEKEWKNHADYKLLREEADAYRPGFIPDLSEFRGDSREIILWEIEDTCPVNEKRIEIIQQWICEMDCWDVWDVMLIITNRFGRGWDVLIDTKKDRVDFFLTQLDDPHFQRTYTHLRTPADIEPLGIWECGISDSLKIA